MSTFLKGPFVPTEAQQDLLFALKKEDEHVFFRAETGTGKSFILAMHALNLSRSLNADSKPTTTILILVPNPDLAIQYHYWIHSILPKQAGSQSKRSEIIQTLFRSEENIEKEQEEKLKLSKDPHIIVSTPTRILDLISQDTELFDFQNIKAIILDEVDELIQPPSPIQTTKIHHKTPAEILLDWIFEAHPKISPRLITTSATLTTTLTDFLTSKPWMSTKELFKHGVYAASTIHTTPRTASQYVFLTSLLKSPSPDTIPDKLVISQPTLPSVTLHHNLRLSPPKPSSEVEYSEYPPNYLAISALQRLIRYFSVNKALALIPHGTSRSSFIWACQYFGMHAAQPLHFSLAEAEQGFLEPAMLRGAGPTLYVAHIKDIRGLDLRNIDVVFIMSEFGSVEDYVHVTGRTGRGKTGSTGTRGVTMGKVVTLLEESEGNMEHKLYNLAVKLHRTGNSVKHLALRGGVEEECDDSSSERLEVAIKPLPGDQWEEIRREKGIIPNTEEEKMKRERATRSFEERRRFLLMDGDAKELEENPISPPVEMDVEEGVLERPSAFGMENLNSEKESKITEVGDWKAALAHSLKGANGKSNIVHYAQNTEAPLPLKLEGEVIGVSKPRKAIPMEIEVPFPEGPKFPLEAYCAALKEVQQHRDNESIGKDATTPTASPDVGHPAAAAHPSAEIPEKDEIPMISTEINISPDSAATTIQHDLESRLDQLEQAQAISELTPAKKNARRRKSKNNKSGKDNDVKKKRARNPRVQKDTQNVDA